MFFLLSFLHKMTGSDLATKATFPQTEIHQDKRNGGAQSQNEIDIDQITLIGR